MGQARVATAEEVAKEIRRHLPGVEDTRLHKLLYYVQGQHLVWQGCPAFREAIEACDNGPVISALSHVESDESEKPACGSLDDSVRHIVVNAIAQVGEMSNKALVEATRAEDPWREVTNEGANVCRQEIPHEALSRFFGCLGTDLSVLKERVDQHRSDVPVEPDPPGAVGVLRAKYLSV